MTEALPILYSFRRCPYAMRARMALAVSGKQCALREVVLRDKPQTMLDASPKATVPVLILSDGTLLDESIDIMQWALGQNDPDNWLGDSTQQKDMFALIKATQTDFKDHLDRYKYPNRYEDIDPLWHRDQAMSFLARLQTQLGDKNYLYAATPMIADIAIFPFIRQFANTNRAWFDSLEGYTPLQNWLERCLALPIFEAVMEKYPQWHEGDEEPLFLPLNR